MDYNDLLARLRAAAATSEVDPDECADAIESLQARVAELEAERDEFYMRYRMDTDTLSKAAIVRAERAEAQLAAARADAARLEWLAQHPREATIRIGGDLKPCTFWGVSSAGTDLRAAIDAAMQEKP